MVVNQPSAAPQTIHVVHNRANEYMVLTLVMMVLCFLHGNLPAFICLIPALIFAMVVSIMYYSFPLSKQASKASDSKIGEAEKVAVHCLVC